MSSRKAWKSSFTPGPAASAQYCKSRRATVHATASAGNADFVNSLGAATVIDYATADFRDAVSDLDVVCDTVGGNVHLRSQSVLRPGGLLVCLNAAHIPERPRREDISVFRRRLSHTNAQE